MHDLKRLTLDEQFRSPRVKRDILNTNLATRKTGQATNCLMHVELENISTAISFLTDDARKTDVVNLYNKGKLLICLQFRIKQNPLRPGAQLSLKTNFKLSTNHLGRVDQLNRLKIDLPLEYLFTSRQSLSLYRPYSVWIQ